MVNSAHSLNYCSVVFSKILHLVKCHVVMRAQFKIIDELGRVLHACTLEHDA